MSMPRLLVYASALLLLTPCGLAQADTVYLKDGGQVRGTARRVEGAVRVEHPLGSVTLPDVLVARIVEGPLPFAPRARPRPEGRDAPVGGFVPGTRTLAPAPAPVWFPGSDALIREDAGRAERAYRAGAAADAGRLFSATGGLLAWREADRIAAVDCIFDGRGATLSVTRRPDVHGAFAVAFPPGTILRSDLGSQDLTLLRAPVVFVAAGEERALVQVPVACGNHGVTSPSQGQLHAPSSAEPGSDVARLLAHLCKGEKPAPEAEGQLAVWAVRNRLKRWQLEPGASTFGSREHVGLANAAGAATLIAASGIDTAKLPLFEGAAAGR